MESQILKQYIRENPKQRFNQCDILKNLSIISQSDIDEENEATISATNLDYAIVVNQECDLEHDYNTRITTGEPEDHDKLLPNLLIVPAYPSEIFRTGKHRGQDFKCTEWKSSQQWNEIKSNRHNRFHSISLNSEFQIPDLVIDFKHVYTMNIALAYKKIQAIYLVNISEIFRENLSQRYTFYLSRIGLPDKSTV